MKEIRQRVTVQEGGRIVIIDPALKEGMEVEVIVWISEPGDEPAEPEPPGPDEGQGG